MEPDNPPTDVDFGAAQGLHLTKYGWSLSHRFKDIWLYPTRKRSGLWMFMVQNGTLVSVCVNICVSFGKLCDHKFWESLMLAGRKWNPLANFFERHSTNMYKQA